MKIIVDQSMQTLGIQDVVIAIARNVDPSATLSSSFQNKQKQVEKWAMSVSLDEVSKHPYIQGYIEMMQKVGRSIKKNPPTILSFIRNIQHSGCLPKVNTIVDIYNVESLISFIAIGGHDLDKIKEPLIFSISQKEDIFYPILSTSKHVAESDYIYKDRNGILAWLGVRDGENYKFDEHTKNAIFILQGNANISVEARVNALKRIENDLKECMPNLVFDMQIIHVKTN